MSVRIFFYIFSKKILMIILRNPLYIQNFQKSYKKSFSRSSVNMYPGLLVLHSKGESSYKTFEVPGNDKHTCLRVRAVIKVCKCPVMTNTLAYRSRWLITALKSWMIHAPDIIVFLWHCQSKEKDSKIIKRHKRRNAISPTCPFANLAFSQSLKVHNRPYLNPSSYPLNYRMASDWAP